MEEAVAAQTRMSLERKLPLLMTAVLLVVLAAGVVVLERELRRSAEVLSANKLKENAITIAKLVEQSGPGLANTLKSFTRDSEVTRILSAPVVSRSDRALLRSKLVTLDSRAATQDSGLISELWAVDRSVLATTGDSTVHIGRPAGGAVSIGRDSISIGTFYSQNGRVYYWATMPINNSSRRVGTLAQRRRINSVDASEKAIRNLAGQSHIILHTNSDGSYWTTLGGRPISPPTNPHTLQAFPTFTHPDVVPDERVVLYTAQSVGTPWDVALELPVSKLSEGPNDIVRRFEIISLILLALGAAAVWFISRRITQPLTRMTSAAEAMARGDYSHRVSESGDREIARLGASFNRMATEVEAANRKLLDAADTAEKAQSVAEDANAAKANFLAAMSHELRTPLNAIAGYVQLLEMGIRGPLTQEQQTDLVRIKRSQEYLLALIEQVLVFTQLEAHTVAINLEDIRLDDVLRDAEHMVLPQINAKGIEYSYLAGEPDLVVRADRDKTQQIVLNLITNGAKYTNPGGRVTVSAKSRNGSALVSVSDSGPGIPEKMLSHIFEPFVQLDRRLNQPREGVGLGLTISRDLARAMGGDVTVESSPGKGATFAFVLSRA
jgi:signal transduction histidine kinase